MPTYKYMKHLFIEKGEFIKTTTNKINEEVIKAFIGIAFLVNSPSLLGAWPLRANE